ncbi:GMC family oxidoreductase [Neolewinella lacunae]|uniref:GMC family oxidoreductase n=1 Tax=Neolewinella lacunae TaxID=1517758 RepID=A0A923PM35_9BACT|nr:GMC family oxidoreductase [Neolewinella lacunae]MBC6996587.1 GMC family oxidoreductase [Neolewinella lacunae]MDN3634849.1 GMC family oxidoreductase [Neolewinella lacunae]
MQIKESSKEYDAVIVGSGAGGGMTAKVLADAGLNIAIIEAGPYFDPADKNMRTQLRGTWESPRRGAGTLRSFGDFHAGLSGWQIPGEPYDTVGDTEFQWWRTRMLGGRTNHWGRISLRFGPDDFHRKDIDGLGENWPIRYEDIAPYYDKVDKLVGVFGTNENLPNDPDSFFLPPPKPRLHELYTTEAGKKVGIPMIPGRLSMVTKKINEDRGVCFYCGQCSRACSVYADFSAGTCLIFPAMKGKGQIDLFTNCMAREVITDASGKATAISYISKDDRREYQVKGKVIVLAASACETARLLFNSKAPGMTAGLGNGSGTLGRYLHDSTGTGTSALIPSLLDRELYNEDGVGGMHVYAPWWGNNKKLDFPRGYHLEVWGGLGMPSYGFGGQLTRVQEMLGYKVGGYGNPMLKEVKQMYGAVVGMSGRGESVALYDNYCEINPGKVDEWGIPTLRFHYKWTDHERLQAKHMHVSIREILTAMGGELFEPEIPSYESDHGLLAPGAIIHEVGTARMHDDPKQGVCDRNSRLHEVPNVYVTDAASFTSQADKNPTWTIMALAWRAADHILSERQKMNI